MRLVGVFVPTEIPLEMGWNRWIWVVLRLFAARGRILAGFQAAPVSRDRVRVGWVVSVQEGLGGFGGQWMVGVGDGSGREGVKRCEDGWFGRRSGSLVVDLGGGWTQRTWGECGRWRGECTALVRRRGFTGDWLERLRRRERRWIGGVAGKRDGGCGLARLPAVVLKNENSS
jgi:hypothetical protein